MYSWTVAEEFSGTKLIEFIHQKLNHQFSARKIKRSIESNGCHLNGKLEHFASTHLNVGDRIEFQFVLGKKVDLKKNDILFEDPYLLAFNKPPGIASDDPAFLNLLGKDLLLLHRLDKETSGVLLFAKSEQFKKTMIELFRKHQVQKDYLALIDGIPKKNKGIINNYLGKIHTYQGQSLWGVVSKEKGLSALTEWDLLKKGHAVSFLHCHPITGRTHQIRVHLSHMGHPILGDHQYGREIKSRFLTSRCLLHASEIAFVHPITQVPISIKAPIPSDMQNAIRELFP